MINYQNFKTVAVISLLSLFFFQTSSYGQEKYLPGYIVRQDGDTIHGFIDYRNWDRNPVKISFKSELTKQAVQYTPIDVMGFSVSNELYAGGIVEVEESPFKPSKLMTVSELKIRIDTVFLQAVVLGSESLYYYKTGKDKDQFYIVDNASFQLLYYKTYLKEVDGKSFATENQQYLGQLGTYLQDCPRLYSKISATKYSRKSLVDLFEFYYECTSSEMDFQWQRESVIFEPGLMAGVSRTALSFGSGAPDYLVNGNFSSSNNFIAGVYLDIVLPKRRRKVIIRNEMLYSSYQSEGFYNDFNNDTFYTLHYSRLGYSQLKFSHMIRIKHSMGNTSIFLNGGITQGIALRETNERTVDATLSGSRRVEQEAAVYPSTKYELGWNSGVGVGFKNFSLELRYEQGNGMSQDATTQRFYLLLQYGF